MTPTPWRNLEVCQISDKSAKLGRHGKSTRNQKDGCFRESMLIVTHTMDNNILIGVHRYHFFSKTNRVEVVCILVCIDMIALIYLEIFQHS